MAIAATVVWECRSTATAAMVNGGGFKPGATGTDYSQQDAAQYNLTGVTSAGAGNTVLTAAAAADMVGNIAHCISGTNATAGWFEITSVSVGTSITVSTSKAGTSIATGAMASGVINIGGALDLTTALVGTWATQIVTGQPIWIKKGNYSPLTTAVTIPNGSAATPATTTGYKATRGDVCVGADRPVIDHSTANWTCGTHRVTSNIIYTGTTGYVSGGTGTKFVNCKSSTTGGSAPAFNLGADSLCVECEGISTGQKAFAGGPSCYSCYAHDSVNGFYMDNFNEIVNCVADTCSTAGINIQTTGTRVVGCTIYNCALGISMGANGQNAIFNNIFHTNTTAIDGNLGMDAYEDFNDFWNNGTKKTNGSLGLNDIITDPLLANPANGNFTIGAGSPVINTARQLGANTGVVGSYHWNMGVDQNDQTSFSGQIMSVF